MAVQSMNLLNITFNKENVFDVLLRANSTSEFHPQEASKFIHHVKNVKTLEVDSSYDNLYHRLQQLSFRLGFELEDIHYHNERLNVDQANAYIDSIEEKLDQIEAVKKDLEVARDENINTLSILENIVGNDLDLDSLFKCQYLNVRIGRIPKANMPKLRYYEGYPFILKVFKEDRFYVWCAYFAIEKDVLEIDNVFSSLAFKRTRIPDFVHGTIDDGFRELQEEISAMNEFIETMKQRINVLKEESRLQLNQLYTKVTHYINIYALSKCVLDYSHLASIYGFVLSDDVDKVKEIFSQVPKAEITVLPEDTYIKQNVIPPVMFNNPRFIKPFETLVSKKYGDYDTTWLMALLCLATSGVFFGDLLVGAILTLLGLVFVKKSNFFKVLWRMGLSSLLFGIVYGTFGFNDVMHSLVQCPFNITQRLGYGILVLIIGRWLVSCVNYMYRSSKENSMVDIIFGAKGISGLVVLFALLFVAIGQIELGKNFLNLPIELIVIVLTLLTLFKKKLFFK